MSSHSGIFIMNNSNKEILLRIDANAIAVLEQEIKTKRNSGVANSVGDRFLIRLLDTLTDNTTKVFLFKIEKNKLIIRNYASLNYDDNRPSGTESREVNGTGPQPVVSV